MRTSPRSQASGLCSAFPFVLFLCVFLCVFRLGNVQVCAVLPKFYFFVCFAVFQWALITFFLRICYFVVICICLIAHCLVLFSWFFWVSFGFSTASLFSSSSLCYFLFSTFSMFIFVPSLCLFSSCCLFGHPFFVSFGWVAWAF